MGISEEENFEDIDYNTFIPPIEKPFTTLNDILTWFRQVSPGFAVDPEKVVVLHEPEEFYKVLLEFSNSAKNQISLASLYLGSGHLEQKLVDVLSENLTRSNGRLSLTVLLDYNRGSRGPVSSRSILLPLVQKHADKCHVALYHTPLLREPVRSWLPGRANEFVGLQHIKLYVFDDNVIISGANLSHDYFTRRQDRYMVLVGAAALARWAHALVAAVARFSLRVTPCGGDALNRGWEVHPFAAAADAASFARAARRLVLRAAFSQPNETLPGAEAEKAEGGGAWVFPLVQMAQLGVRHDSVATARLLAAAPPGGHMALATAYFNPPSEYADALLRCCRAPTALLAAHPRASGFAGAPGLAGAVPLAYDVLATDFQRRLRAAAPAANRTTLMEYARDGWTFHAKGLWMSLPTSSSPIPSPTPPPPALTLVGSPNFGARSLARDLEVQLALVTNDARLQAALADERDRLFAHAQPAPPARPPAPLWVRVAARLVRDFL